MDDNPVATRRHPRMIVLATVLAALIVVGSVLWATRSGPEHNATKLAQQSSPNATPAPTRPPPTGTTVTPDPRAAAPRDFVAAAAPTSFSIKGTAFTIKADVCGMDYVRPLDPPGNQHHTVCWVQRDFGVAPGSKAGGTTYVLGHAWARDRLEVLNPLSETAMRQVLPLRRQGRTTDVSGIPTYPVTKLDGYVVRLRTANGTLRYTVRDAYAVAKDQAGNVAPLMAEHTRNRVVIITCGELNAVDYDYNIIVEAYLTSSVAVRPST